MKMQYTSCRIAQKVQKRVNKKYFPHATSQTLCVNVLNQVYFVSMSDPLMTNMPPSDHSPVSNSTSSHATSSQGRGFAWYVIFALGFALVIRFFIAAPYVVSGASMEPTFDNWDYLITDRFIYRVIEPERGDVIVFCLPDSGECSFVKRVQSGEWTAPRTLIKRVIGLPGDTVSVQGNTVRITNGEHPEGFTLDEPYLSPENFGGPSNVTKTLQEGEYFVLGDNRHVSSDSRVWGVLPKENIIGHVLVRLFPLQSLGFLPGDATYLNDTSSPAEAE
jgi:signal peptidase I